jgi:transposase
MKKTYIVTLTEEERESLHGLLAAGKVSARKQAHARILVKADAAPGGPAWPDERIAEALDAGLSTVARVRQRFVEQGLDGALHRKPQGRPSRPVTLDPAAEARLIALACSDPPRGRCAWTLRLLAGKLVELEVVDHISHETVRRALKKTTYSRT